MIPKSQRTPSTTTGPCKKKSALSKQGQSTTTAANNPTTNISVGNAAVINHKNTAASQAFLDATSILKGLLSQPTQLLKNKDKKFLSTLKIIQSQLHSHHTKNNFLTLTPDIAITYSKLLSWFLNTHGVVEVDTLSLVIHILAYVIPIPLSTSSIGDTQRKSQLKEHQQQSSLSPMETIQHHLFSHLLGQIDCPLFQSQFLLPFLTILRSTITNHKSVQSQQAIQSALIHKAPIISALLTIFQQAVQWAIFIKKKSKISLITESTPIYIILGRVFDTYVNDWSLQTRTQAEIIAMIVEIITLMIGYHSPSESDQEQSSEDSEKTIDDGIYSQTQHVNVSDEGISSLCSIIFNILCSIITHKIQHKTHPLLSVLAPQGPNSKQHQPSDQTLQIFNTISHQVFNIAHYLTVCYVTWFSVRSIDSMTPAEQVKLQQSENNPWQKFISDDFLKLICLWLQHLDNANLISIDDEQQSAVRRIVGTLMSGARCEMMRIFSSGYFDFLVSLVWDEGNKKMRPSAIVLRPESLNVQTPEQKKQVDQAYSRQQAIEINRITFFTLSLDIFILWTSMGYSARYLLLKQYSFVDILDGLLSEKVFSIDQIMRKQATVVEKIALFIKNVSVAMDFYYEFDYTMYFQMAGFGSSFPLLKEEQLKFCGLTSQQLQDDPKLEKLLEQRIADDVYSVFTYHIYHGFQFSRLFAHLYPTLCLYYSYPNLPDIDTIMSGGRKTPTKPSEQTAFDQDMDKMIAYAMIQGGIEQQKNNFIICADLINFTTFTPLFHLYAYIPGHFAQRNIDGCLEKTRSTLSPIFAAGFTVLLGTPDIDFQTLGQSFQSLTKDNVKSVLLGLHQNNKSNDDPKVTMVKYFDQTSPNSDVSDQEAQIDTLVTQIALFTYSLLHNKETKPEHEIPPELCFTRFRALELKSFLSFFK